MVKVDELTVEQLKELAFTEEERKQFLHSPQYPELPTRGHAVSPLALFQNALSPN
jgi:hypothetical protein